MYKLRFLLLALTLPLFAEYDREQDEREYENRQYQNRQDQNAFDLRQKQNGNYENPQQIQDYNSLQLELMKPELDMQEQLSNPNHPIPPK